MKSFITGVFVCSLAQLSFGAPPHPHAHDHLVPGPDDKYLITLHVNSGKPDPSWKIPREGVEDPVREARIIKLLNIVGHGMDNKQWRKGGELADLNGYKGVSVEHFDSAGKSLHKWQMPVCFSPVLEWNLVIKTASTDIVSLGQKRAVHEALLTCPNTKTTKKTTERKAETTSEKRTTKKTDTQNSSSTNTKSKTA